MKLKSILLAISMCIGFYLLALLFAYFFWWTDYYDAGVAPGFMYLGVCGSALSSGILISFLFVIPRKANVDLSLFFKKEKLIELIGKKLMNRLRVVIISLFITLLFIYGFLFYKLTDIYEAYHLTTYGQTVTVQVDQIIKSQKGFKLATINYSYNGRSFYKELLTDKYQKGDSAIVIFSKERPVIACWYEEFKKQNP